MEQNDHLNELILAIQELNQRLAWFQERAESRGKGKKRSKPLSEYRQDNARIYHELIDFVQNKEWDNMRFEDADGCISKCGKIGAVYISIEVSVFHKFFQQAYASEREFFYWAERNGILLKGYGGRNSRVIRFPGSKTTSRCVTLKLNMNDESKEE